MQIDQQIEDMFASRKRVTDVAKPLMGQTVQPTASLQSNLPQAKNTQALELAKRLASRIHMAKNIGAEAQDITQQAAVSLFRDGVAVPQVSVSRKVDDVLQSTLTLRNVSVLWSLVIFQQIPLRSCK